MPVSRWMACCLSVLLATGLLPIQSRADDIAPSHDSVSAKVKTKKHASQAVATPTPIVTPQPLSPESPRLSFGIGYPDLRLKAKIWGDLDGEFKFAFDNDTQAYSVRLYYTFWKWWLFDFNLGGEAGYIRFAGIDTLTGNGVFYEPFVGIRYNANKLISLTTEIGPAFMNVSADGESIPSTNTIVTTGLYFHLF